MTYDASRRHAVFQRQSALTQTHGLLAVNTAGESDVALPYENPRPVAINAEQIKSAS